MNLSRKIRSGKSVADKPQGRRIILFPRPDTKFQLWAEALDSVSDTHTALPAWRPWFSFWHFIRYRIQGRRIDAFVIRYLNDPGSLPVATCRLAGEFLTLNTARALGIRIFWILHNIDRETCHQRPWIVHLRRRLARTHASAVFVTEECLIKHARSHHRIRAPIKVMPLGVPDDSMLTSAADARGWRHFRTRAEAWMSIDAQNGSRSLCLLVTGTPEDKYTHFWRLRELLDQAARQDIPLKAIIIAPLDKAYGKQLRAELASHEAAGRVLFSEKYVEIDWSWAARNCTALLRGYSDLSMSHAIYHAVAVGMPVLAIPGGVVHEVVMQEGIGAVLAEDFSNLGAVLPTLRQLDLEIMEAFLSRRTGVKAAETLLEALNSS